MFDQEVLRFSLFYVHTKELETPQVVFRFLIIVKILWYQNYFLYVRISAVFNRSFSPTGSEKKSIKISRRAIGETRKSNDRVDVKKALGFVTHHAI